MAAKSIALAIVSLGLHVEVDYDRCFVEDEIETCTVIAPLKGQISECWLVIASVLEGSVRGEQGSGGNLGDTF